MPMLIGLSMMAVGSSGHLVCLVLVLVKMFQNRAKNLAMLCIALSFCLGFGSLIAFLLGWLHCRDWGIRNLMLIWAACIISSGLGYFLVHVELQEFHRIHAQKERAFAENCSMHIHDLEHTRLTHRFHGRFSADGRTW